MARESGKCMLAAQHNDADDNCWFELNFLSSCLGSLALVRQPICLTIYQELRREQMDTCPSKGREYKVQHKVPCSVFEPITDSISYNDNHYIKFAFNERAMT